MENVRTRYKELLRAAYEARLGAAINEEIADVVFAAHQERIEQAIEAMTAEAVADMDEETRRRYAAFMLGELEKEIARLRAETSDMVQRLVEAQATEHGE